MARGRLRVHLGAAPGVGKTYAALAEARDRRADGVDVVVGFVETHGRSATAAMVGDLEVVPRRRMSYRGATLEEMDLDAVRGRAPDLAVVDELAHTNAPGCRNPKRWQDVEELRDAGIDVLTTVNVQHLESLNDSVARITGVTQAETVPDQVVRDADEIELVDLSEQAIRNRLAAGLIYPPERIDAALANYFRSGNLSALRELALSWTADRVDETLDAYREAHGIAEPWETRERVVVAMTGAPANTDVIRRAARMAMRTRGELVGVHVASADGLVGPPDTTTLLAHQRTLLEALGGTFREIAGADIASALVSFARAENATQLVLGASRRTRLATVVQGSVINDVIRAAAPIDVHVIAPDADAPVERTRLPSRSGRPGLVSRRRRGLGWAIAVVGVPAVTLPLVEFRSQVSLPTALLAYLFVVVASAATGGFASSLAASIAGFLLANALFTDPVGTLVVIQPQDVVALVMFVTVAVVVALLVRQSLKRADEAVRARTEADALTRAATSLASDPDPLAGMAEQVRRAFDQLGVAVLVDDDGSWRTETAVGPDAPRGAEEADATIELGPRALLALRGPHLRARELDTLQAFAAQVSAALDRRVLAVEASRAEQLSAANELRTALLRAVSHDLKSPLASIKASVSSLRARDVAWSPDDTAEFLASIELETERLIDLITNLLDVSRLDARAVDATLRDVALEDVVAAATARVPPARGLHIDVPESLPTVHADSALLERAVANLVDNAVTHAPEDDTVVVTADVVAGQVHLRIVDHGPGIPLDQREAVFEPFQHRGDGVANRGNGLGLAVARGMTEASAGRLELSDTPGGGVTATIVLDVHGSPAASGPGPEEGCAGTTMADGAGMAPT